MFTNENTQGYTKQQMDALNEELLMRLELNHLTEQETQDDLANSLTEPKLYLLCIKHAQSQRDLSAVVDEFYGDLIQRQETWENSAERLDNQGGIDTKVLRAAVKRWYELA